MKMQISEIADEDLMLKAQRGELDTIGLLYERYSKRIFNFFLKLTGNYDSSADLTQNVFYRVIKYKNSYKPEHQFKTWLYQLARNSLKDYKDNIIKNPIIGDTDKALSDIIDDDAAGKQELQDKQLFKAIEKLPFESRELLVMSKFQGLSYDEISEITGDSISNIKVKVHRTLLKLKELYFELENA
jgi:RNA polymerase sigma-70 factor (ECF subfamily)